MSEEGRERGKEGIFIINLAVGHTVLKMFSYTVLSVSRQHCFKVIFKMFVNFPHGTHYGHSIYQDLPSFISRQ